MLPHNNQKGWEVTVTNTKRAPLAPLDSRWRLSPDFIVLESSLCLDLLPHMTDANARQRAEDFYYSALDLMAEGHMERAIAAYQESLTADPTFTEAMHGLARALQDLQRFDEAIEVAKRIAEIDPDDVLAHTSLSVLYQKKGMIPEAEAEGAKARVLGWKQQLKKGT
jgi:tetratricopeptide (TPR) repeat protein